MLVNNNVAKIHQKQLNNHVHTHGPLTVHDVQSNNNIINAICEYLQLVLKNSLHEH